MVRMTRAPSRRGGGSGRPIEEGPPEQIVEVGEVLHSCEENQVLCTATIDRIPWFNRNIYLENKSPIGKTDEILGTLTEFMFSVKVLDNMKAASFKPGTKVYMNPQYLFPKEKFTNPENSQPSRRGARGGGRRGSGPPRRGDSRPRRAWRGR